MAGGRRELDNQAAHRDNVAGFGRGLWEQELRSAQEQMAVFQRKLETFAREHKDKIRRDPEFRSEFNRMCLTLDVDPLQSKNGFWSKHLGFGSFYHELSIKIIRVCVGLKRQYGALVPIEHVISAIHRLSKDGPKITENDIEMALKTLKSIGQGYAVVPQNKKKFVQTVSFELDELEMALLDLAKDTGFFTVADQGRIRISGTLNEETIGRARQKLLDEGLIWVDRAGVDPAHQEERWYVVAFFPGFT
jgi:ESCRT-II complex subunit VPS22